MSEIRKLKNGFTTTEQSNRLLELGIPIVSADCYIGMDDKPHIINDAITWLLIKEKQYTPCWSVGRLQEIAKISAREKEYYYAALDSVGHQDDFVEWWVKHFTLTDNVLFDFSKLEEII